MIKRTEHLKSSCVPESRSWVLKSFPASLESRTETVGGAGAGTGWNHGSLTSSTGNTDCSQCQLLFSFHFQPLGMITLANAELLDYSVVSKSRGRLFPSCSFSRRKLCTKMTPYWLTGGLVEGEFLSPYKLCTVKYIIYFLRKSISPPEYVPHGPGKKSKL